MGLSNKGKSADLFKEYENRIEIWLLLSEKLQNIKIIILFSSKF